MIPANGNFIAYIKPSGNGGWPTSTGRRVLAWDDQGRALVLGKRGLIPAEEFDGFEGVREVPLPVDPADIPHVYFGDDEDDGELPVMQEQTIIALQNYDWLIRNTRDGLNEVGLHWESDTLSKQDGGYAIQEICRAGFTPATSAPQPEEKEAVTLPANSRFRRSR